METHYQPHPHHTRLTIGSDGSVYDTQQSQYLKQTKDSRGYSCVYFKGQRLLVHRLVAETFISNPEGHHYVLHKDGNKRHNDISNLEWFAYSSYRTVGNLQRNGGQRVPIGTCTEKGELLQIYLGYDQAIQQGYNRNGINQAIRCGCKHKGDYWRYVSKLELAVRHIDTTGFRFYRED